jgi:hypothetical protein
MGKWQLLDYPCGRVAEDVPGAALRQLLKGKPAYLLHGQVIYLMGMETRDGGGVRERTLTLEAIAALGELGHSDLAVLRERGPLQSAPLRLLSFEDRGATEQVDGLLSERAAQAFLDDVHEDLHK